MTGREGTIVNIGYIVRRIAIAVSSSYGVFSHALFKNFNLRTDRCSVEVCVFAAIPNFRKLIAQQLYLVRDFR